MKKYLFCAALLLSGAASAQSGSPASSPNGAGARGDPNQMICRSVREIGSMLSRSRVCKTRAQWEEDRRLMRQNIDQSQTNRRGPDNS